MFHLALTLILFFSCTLVISANDGKPLTGQIADPMVEAQEKLLHAKGNYKTIKQQESAIEDLRRATKLSLKASKLRARAEKLQVKSDMLAERANQVALSRGLYITNPMSPVMMQSPPGAMAQEQSAQKPPQAQEQITSIVPVPGQAINILIPKQPEQVSYDNAGSNAPQNTNNESENSPFPEPPPPNEF